MALFHPSGSVPPHPEAEREARLARERQLAAEADADIEAGLGIKWSRAQSWLRALDQDQELPLPTSEAVRL